MEYKINPETMAHTLQILNLDKNFNPVYSAYTIKFKSMDFYSGFEPHIKLEPESFHYSDDMVTLITARPTNGNDLFRIFLATNAIRELKKDAKIWLFLPFVPFARQDRVCVSGEPLSIKVFSTLLNTLKYDRVFVFDPHSSVAPALIDNCCIIKNDIFINSLYKALMNNRCVEEGPLLFVSPDAGAYKKIFDTAKSVGYPKDLNIIMCDKVRDLTTGKIIQTTVNVDDIHGADVLIVDDICDGGRTFIEIAKELKKRNCGKVFLAVTFGIFSNGFDELSEYFDSIYCTNLFKDIDHPLVKVINIQLMNHRSAELCNPVY